MLSGMQLRVNGPRNRHYAQLRRNHESDDHVREYPIKHVDFLPNELKTFSILDIIMCLLTIVYGIERYTRATR